MKSVQRSLFAMLMVALAACSEDPVGIPRETPREFTFSETRLADASVTFGLKFYREVAAA